MPFPRLPIPVAIARARQIARIIVPAEALHAGMPTEICQSSAYIKGHVEPAPYFPGPLSASIQLDFHITERPRTSCQDLDSKRNQKVRRAHEGTISSTLGVLPALHPKPTRSGDAELVQAPHSVPAQPEMYAFACPPDRGYGRKFSRHPRCSQAPCRKSIKTSLASSFQSEPDMLLLSLTGRPWTHVHWAKIQNAIVMMRNL